MSWNNDSWTTNCVPSTSDSEWWLDSPANTKFIKRYRLGEPGGEKCKLDYGWLTQDAINRIEGYATKPDNTPKLKLSGNKDLTLVIDGDPGTFPHVIVGAPDASPNQWILGWEDLRGGGDTDHNDLVFLIDRDTGGTAQLTATEAPGSQNRRRLFYGGDHRGV